MDSQGSCNRDAIRSKRRGLSSNNASAQTAIGMKILSTFRPILKHHYHRSWYLSMIAVVPKGFTMRCHTILDGWLK